jgi:hypothetical protein
VTTVVTYLQVKASAGVRPPGSAEHCARVGNLERLTIEPTGKRDRRLPS